MLSPTLVHAMLLSCGSFILSLKAMEDLYLHLVFILGSIAHISP